MPKGKECYPAVFGFDLYGFVSWLVRLFETDVFGRFDNLGHVGVESAADYDVDARLGAFVGANADKR